VGELEIKSSTYHAKFARHHPSVDQDYRMSLIRPLVLTIGIATVLSSISGCSLVDDKLYAGSTPSNRANHRNTIFDEGENHVPVEQRQTAAAATPKSTRSGVWETNIEAAAQRAQKTGRPMLLSFSGSDWCHYCQEMDKAIYQTAAFKKFASEEVIAVELDFPKKKAQSASLKKQNAMLRDQFQIDGFPSVVILRPTGEFIGKGGYQSGATPEDFIGAIREATKR